MPIARGEFPSELAWFFIQYPYLSPDCRIIPKNHHTFLVEDGPRRRNYVVNFGQRYRRVELYQQNSRESQVQIFTPGSKRTVVFNGRASSPNRLSWTATCGCGKALVEPGASQIYGLADRWLDSPFKRYSCAGFVHRFLKDVDVQVPVLDAWDMARLHWVRVPLEELEPGDIITFKALTGPAPAFLGHRVTHVGVYIGNGKFIHAASLQ